MDAPIREEIGPDGVAVWWFDKPGEKVNTLDKAVMACLEERIAAATRNPSLQAILIASAKPGQFIAGADLEEMRGLLGAVDAADRARQASALGHRAYAALEALRIPTVAVINGACLGGGTELALACRYRVMADDPEFRISLPEVKLGILPAWGGCTRLPRLIGVSGALDFILNTRALRPDRARRLGLVDDLVPAEDPLGAARLFLKRQSGPRPPGGSWFLDRNPLGRAVVFSKAASNVRTQTGGNYPAPDKVLAVVRAGIVGGSVAGFAAEEKALGELVALPVTRHLVDLFFMIQENKRYTGGIAAEPRDAAQVGVLGAGLMGAGIAGVAAGKGLSVRLKDTDAKAVARGFARIAADAKGRGKQDRRARRELEQRMARVAPATTWDGFRRTDVLIEAVPEMLPLKKKVLAEFQAACPGGIFASNTSTLPISSIAEGAPDPGRVVGLHFFNPVPKMPLVEVIPGEKTSPETAATAIALAKRLGKFVVVVKDRPGFLVNRILAPYLNEAALCLEEGAPMQAVDAALRRFGMPMGPVELIQQVGLGVVQHAGQVMEAAFPERLQGAALLKRLKPDQPFYLGKGRGKSPNPAVGALLDALRRERGQAMKDKDGWTEAGLQERLILPMVNEAAWALAEGVVGSAREVDLAMIFGTGFPAFRGGLLRHADAVGVRACAEGLNRLEKSLGPRFACAPLLREMAASGRPFYPA